MADDDIEEMLDLHKAALEEYNRWDDAVKKLLKGRRVKDLTEEDMLQYREAARARDAAYDRMRHLERELLDSIPGATTGRFKPVRPETDNGKDE